MKAKQQQKENDELFEFKEENKFVTKNKNLNNIKNFNEENEILIEKKKTPPQVPPKLKSLNNSIEERIGTLYSFVEEYPLLKSNISKQRVNVVELSAHLDRPYENKSKVNAYIPLLTTRTTTRVESPPLSPSTIPYLLEINENKNSKLNNFSKQIKDQSPFRLGPCPTSYLTQNNRKQQQRIKICQKSSQISSSIDDDGDIEEGVSISINSSAMDNSSCLSVPILFRRNSALSSVTTSAFTFQPETAILDEEIESEENCTEIFFLRRRNKHSILNAVIYPEQYANVKATFCGNNFQVDVERMSECGRDSVVMVSEEFSEKKVIIRSGSPLLKSTIMEEIERENSDSPGYIDANTRMAVSINAKSDYDSVHVFLEEIPWGQIGLEVKESPKIKKNKEIKYDNHYNQNIAMTNSISSSHSRESILKQISVSEGNQQRRNNNNISDDISGRFSIRSASRRSSQKSLAHSTGSGTTTILVGGQEDDFDDIPAYVIKIGSTASITCELNSECISNVSNIEWIRGQNEQIICLEDGKFERQYHDFVEVLIIYNVNHEDGQLYSVKINGEIYPVAYLIIEEQTEEEEEGKDEEEINNVEDEFKLFNRQKQMINEEIFLTSPQTQFVMQGETAIISVSMNKANLDVFWHKDGQILDSSVKSKLNDRILFESTTNGWYRIIIQNVQFSDQGFYFAQIGDKFTSVQLIVEDIKNLLDRIDEREVQVSSAETDDEDLGDYLVPIGSTATIACELENVSFGYRLHWQRNHKDLDSRIVSDEGKFEHVVNGTKHYLIIHCAQPCDSVN
ncbi:hypothetical protein Mgra_00007148 [Meloidogyne graminicola]|uniref:Immunoglobulin domain-containing protein n=1 Tax=Meloidogyne graminicola TaxID=189291 RepID=A0A8S9ZJD8_9BILA|nr:hypothetical protein Mgra_00007148 [Meloidogyne graminicola]